MKLHIITFLVSFNFVAIANNTTNLTEEDRQVFIETFAQLAVDEMLFFGIPSSITLAQAILESNWGQGATALIANNYFGIKCHNGWEGPTYYAMDDESGKSCFRMYNDVVQSFRDHSLFLKQGNRYRELFNHPVTDYESWANGLKSCGYATDSLYAEKLIGIIQRYGLFVYDYAMPLDRVDVVEAPVQNIGADPLGTNIDGFPQPHKTANDVEILKAPGYKLTQLPGEGFFDAPSEQQKSNHEKPAAVVQKDKPFIIAVRPVHEAVMD